MLSPGHPFYDASDHLLSLALDANDAGDYFPVRRVIAVGIYVLSSILALNHRSIE